MGSRLKLIFPVLASAVLLGSATSAWATISLTWSVQDDFGASTTTRSVRGLALSSDDSTLYAGFIQGAGGTTAIRALPTATVPSVATSSISLSGGQPKGVATDDRGYVYATKNNSAGSTSESVGVYDAGLSAQVGSFTQTGSPAFQLGGIATYRDGSNYYAYTTTNKGSAVIERWNVTNVNAITLDTSWGTGGAINLKSVAGWTNAFANGLEVASDGTLYVTGGILSTGRGDSVFEIPADGNLSSASRVDVSGAMDLALYGGEVFVAQYLAQNSQLTVLNGSDLSFVQTLSTGLSHQTLDDTGYSGIDISANGNIYISDQIYAGTAGNAQDRILVSSALPSAAPEPASLGALAIGGVALFVRRRRSV